MNQLNAAFLYKTNNRLRVWWFLLLYFNIYIWNVWFPLKYWQTKPTTATAVLEFASRGYKCNFIYYINVNLFYTIRRIFKRLNYGIIVLIKYGFNIFIRSREIRNILQYSNVINYLINSRSKYPKLAILYTLHVT